MYLPAIHPPHVVVDVDRALGSALGQSCANCRVALFSAGHLANSGPTLLREHCTTCGFYLPMAGALRSMVGVCTNAWSPSDGQVVSLDHGCGAHSEVDVVVAEPIAVDPPVLDELTLDVLVP